MYQFTHCHESDFPHYGITDWLKIMHLNVIMLCVCVTGNFIFFNEWLWVHFMFDVRFIVAVVLWSCSYMRIIVLDYINIKFNYLKKIITVFNSLNRHLYLQFNVSLPVVMWIGNWITWNYRKLIYYCHKQYIKCCIITKKLQYLRPVEQHN